MDTLHPTDRLGEGDILNNELPLALVVQSLCLKLALQVLFGVSVQGTGEVHISTLSAEINRIWVASKTEDSPSFESEHKLRNALSAIFPDWNIEDPAANPLNFIIPAYETLWRIVLRIFLDITFFANHRCLKWQEIMVEYLKNLTKEQMYRQAHTPEGSVSAEFLVLEGLRLYPPTRRIYRAF